MNIITLLIGIALLGIGIGLGYLIRQLVAQQRKSSIESKLKKLIEDSKVEAKETLLEAKEKAAAVIDEAKKEEKERLLQLRRLEERLLEREDATDRKAKEFDAKDKELAERIEKVKAYRAEVDALKASITKELERVSGLSKESALAELVSRLEKDHSEDIMLRVKKLEAGGMEDLERRAKNILAALIQRVATSTTSEVTTTTVVIPSDDLKGKIIGREGRNIKTLERAAGVEIIVDDTPGSIVISGFDP